MQIEIRNSQVPAKQEKIVAYCRVSDDGDRLLASLDAQKAHYMRLIPHLYGCLPVGIYADEGVSGTSAERPAFRQMLADCEAGLIDVILCKSVSRFSRNTVDFLTVCRRLNRIGVDVRFEKENLSTASVTGEVLLSLLSSFAEEESRSISENIKWGIRRKFEKGLFPHYLLYGYRFDGERYVTEPHEAVIVKDIFDRFLMGQSTWEIKKTLAERGVKSPTGSHFSIATIRRILQNPTYTGDRVLQREYIENHLTHRRQTNNGELAKYVVHGSHPPIVTQEQFEKVQAELQIRVPKKQVAWHSGKIFCGLCGRAFRLLRKYGKVGRFYCKGRELHTCDAPSVTETVLFSVVTDLVGTLCNEQIFADHVERITVFRTGFNVKTRSGGMTECRL